MDKKKKLSAEKVKRVWINGKEYWKMAVSPGMVREARNSRAWVRFQGGNKRGAISE